MNIVKSNLKALLILTILAITLTDYSISNFSNKVYAQEKENGPHKTCQFAIESQFYEVKKFSEGMAPVMKNGKWGYIDKTGKIVINRSYAAR